MKLENKIDKKLVILISGITGGGDTSIVKNFFKFLQTKTTFEILTFNFAETTSFKSYVNYIDKNIDKIKSDYSEIFLIGHSFGALVVTEFYNVYKNKYVINKIIFWDPSDSDQLYYAVKNHSIFNTKENRFEILSKNNTQKISFSATLLDEIHNFNINKKLNNLNKLLIIGAEKGAANNAIGYNNLFKKSEILIIKNTGHMFGNYNSRKLLFKKSIDFFLKN